jgi:DNA-binding NarL/FixJ family response regulator
MPETTIAKRRVLLVEDHPIVRHGLRAMIDDEADLKVVGEAASVDEAIPLLRSLRPDVAVVDIALGTENGLDLIRRAHEEFPDMPLLALSMHDESVYGERALRAGAKGYIMKKEAMDKVLTAVRRVLAGELYVSEQMSSRLVSKLLNPGAVRDAQAGVESLSEREFQVFRLIADGVGPSEIAQRLSLSVKTVETHREHIKEKLGLKSGAELTRFSLQWAMEHR